MIAGDVLNPVAYHLHASASFTNGMDVDFIAPAHFSLCLQQSIAFYNAQEDDLRKKEGRMMKHCHLCYQPSLN